MTVTQDWISVEDVDRLPHIGTCVWVFIVGTGVLRGHRREDGWYADTIRIASLDSVTYWQDVIVPEAPDG